MDSSATGGDSAGGMSSSGGAMSGGNVNGNGGTVMTGGATTSDGGDSAAGGSASGGVVSMGGGDMGTGGAVQTGGTGSSTGGTGASDGGSGAGGSGTGGSPFGAPAAYDRNCAMCHGPDGKGIPTGKNSGPEVEHASPELVDYYVYQGDNNIWGGTAGCEKDPNSVDYATRGCDKWGDQREMPQFTTDDIDAAAFDEIKTWLLGLPMPTTGRTLWDDFCANCHGPGGDIPALTYYVKSKTIMQKATAAEFVTTVKMGLTKQVPDRRDAYMPPQGAMLSDGDIESIRAWLCTLPHTDAMDMPMTPEYCK